MSEQLNDKQKARNKHIQILKRAAQLKKGQEKPPVQQSKDLSPSTASKPKSILPAKCIGPGCLGQVKSTGGCGCGGRRNKN